MNCPKCEHGMFISPDLAYWMCTHCGWREKYVESKTIIEKWDLSPNESILCTYKGIVDGKHLFIPVTQGEVKVEGLKCAICGKDFQKGCGHYIEDLMKEIENLNFQNHNLESEGNMISKENERLKEIAEKSIRDSGAKANTIIYLESEIEQLKKK